MTLNAMAAFVSYVGAGKSTLLNILAGRIRTGELTGEIRVNGEPPGDVFRSYSAYVEQDDLMFATLSVLETLRIAAMLRLPNELSRKEKYKRVDRVIQSLGLARIVCLDMQCTVTDQFIRGAQRNRKLIPLAGHARFCFDRFFDESLGRSLIERLPALIARHFWVIANGHKCVPIGHVKAPQDHAVGKDGLKGLRLGCACHFGWLFLCLGETKQTNPVCPQRMSNLDCTACW